MNAQIAINAVEVIRMRLSCPSNNAAGAYASPLKFPVGGNRDRADGALDNVGTYGMYWSSTVNGSGTFRMYFHSSNAATQNTTRANGHSVRCIKN